MSHPVSLLAHQITNLYNLVKNLSKRKGDENEIL